MAHVEKYTRGAMGSMLAHYNRTKASSTSIIDPSRTHLNYNLAAEVQPMPPYEYFQKRKSEIYVHGNANVGIVSWVITKPKTLFKQLFFRC